MYLYHSKLADPVWLEKMLFGRRDTADWLEKSALLFASTGKATQSLLIGNRGMGKSHLMSVLYHRLVRAEPVRKNVVIAYLEEDPYGIADYLDLLRRILKAIAQKEQDQAARQRLQEAHRVLVATEPKQRIATAQHILLEHLAGRRMLLLVENLNHIFEALGEEGQSRWRDFLQANDNTMICATSQAIFSAVQSRERPFFGFFHVTYLQKLRYSEARDLLLAMAEAQNNTELIAYIDTPEGQAKLRAIFELTEGNHRLLVAFFEFFMAEFRSELSKSFLRTVDQLKPYYESFLKLLPPQQQKIVQFLVQERIPQPGRAIADNCFLAINALSKQMSELQRFGYVQNTRQGRDAYYEITEPMLRMCLESNENTDGILSIFVDFLGNLYPAQDLKFHFLRFQLMANTISDPDLRSKMVDEAYLYRKAVVQYANNWEPDAQELDVLREASPHEQEQMMRRVVEDSEVPRLDVEKFRNCIKEGRFQEAERMLDEVFPAHLSYHYWSYLGDLLIAQAQTEKAERAYRKAVEIKPDRYKIWVILIGLFKENAPEYIQEFVEKCPENSEKYVIYTFFHCLIENINGVIDGMYKLSYSKEINITLMIRILINGSKSFIKTFLLHPKWKEYIKPYKKTALPNAIQDVTKELIKTSNTPAQLHDFHAVLTEVYGKQKSMYYPLKFLHLGIRHVKENDPKAMLELTLEERRVFEREILGKAEEGG